MSERTQQADSQPLVNGAGSRSRVAELVESVYRKGFFHLLSANVIIGFLGFGSQLLVVRFLTPLEMGQIKAMQSFMAVAVIAAGFGFNTSVLKLCSENRPDADKSAILRRNLLFTLIPTLVVLAALSVAAQLEWLSPDPVVNRWTPVFMWMVPAGAYTALLMMYLQARKRIRVMANLQTGVRLFGVAAVVGLTYLLGLRGFVFATVAVALLALAPLFYLVRGDLRRTPPGQATFSESFFYARWGFAANVVGTVGAYLDIFLLNYLIEDREGFGYYSVATVFVLGLNFITQTVQSVTTPYFSEKSGNRAEFVRVLAKYQKLMVLLAAGVTVAAVVAVPPLIEALYGADYAPAGQFFRVLAVKYFLWSSFALLGIAIWGLGKIQYNFLNACALVVVSTAVTYLLIRSHGLMGAAVAQVIAHAVVLVLVVLVSRAVIRRHFEARESGRSAV